MGRENERTTKTQRHREFGEKGRREGRGKVGRAARGGGEAKAKVKRKKASGRVGECWAAVT